MSFENEALSVNFNFASSSPLQIFSISPVYSIKCADWKYEICQQVHRWTASGWGNRQSYAKLWPHFPLQEAGAIHFTSSLTTPRQLTTEKHVARILYFWVRNSLGHKMALYNLGMWISSFSRSIFQYLLVPKNNLLITNDYLSLFDFHTWKSCNS